MSGNGMDKGSTLYLEERNGAVILTIKDAYAVLTPDQAAEIAETMAKYAYSAKTGIEPKTKSMIAERIRAELVPRCSLVLKGELDKGKKPLHIAKTLVDIMLSAAL